MSDSSNQLMPLSLSAPGVNLGAYISTVNQIPILTAEQEKELLNVIIMTKILMLPKCW
jgi:RNA polymerase sigma-32 factor